MGRVGSAFDNPMAETTFATLKTELVYQRAWASRHELEMEVFSNTLRRHSGLDNLSAIDYEERHLTHQQMSGCSGSHQPGSPTAGTHRAAAAPNCRPRPLTSAWTAR